MLHALLIAALLSHGAEVSDLSPSGGGGGGGGVANPMTADLDGDGYSIYMDQDADSYWAGDRDGSIADDQVGLYLGTGLEYIWTATGFDLKSNRLNSDQSLTPNTYINPSGNQVLVFANGSGYNFTSTAAVFDKSLNIAGAEDLFWTSKTRFDAPQDARIRFCNNAQTACSQWQIASNSFTQLSNGVLQSRYIRGYGFTNYGEVTAGDGPQSWAVLKTVGIGSVGLNTTARIWWGTDNFPSDSGSDFDVGFDKVGTDDLLVSANAGGSIPGVLRSAKPVNSSGTATLDDIETASIVTNDGAGARIDMTLPTAAAGIHYTFVVENANGIKIVAGAGDTITIGSTTSGAAGYVCSVTAGDTLQLYAINATKWVAHAIGTWTVDSGCP